MQTECRANRLTDEVDDFIFLIVVEVSELVLVRHHVCGEDDFSQSRPLREAVCKLQNKLLRSKVYRLEHHRERNYAFVDERV